jgi:transposase InsO family protein
LRHCDRKLLHSNITKNPTAQWTANQIVQAFPYDTVPKYLIRDRDSIYGKYFQYRVKNMDIKQVIISYKSPWQNPFVERIIGSIRRECLDHMIVLNEGHLRRILKEYSEYYNEIRPHLSLYRNSPIPRSVKSIEEGDVAATQILGGLHHSYSRAA